MKKHPSTLILAALALGLAGCSSTESAPQAPNVEPATASSTPSPTRSLSDRGNLVKKVGEVASITGPEGASQQVVTFTVNKITADPKCTGSYAQKPENGHLVAVDISAETGSKEVIDEVNYGNPVMFQSSLWKYVTPKGTTVNTLDSVASFMCFDQKDQLPNQIGPREKVSGVVVFDVPQKGGTLIYADPGTQNGFEWKVPAK